MEWHMFFRKNLVKKQNNVKYDEEAIAAFTVQEAFNSNVKLDSFFPFLSLPQEVLLHNIVSFLNYSDISRLARTCSNLNALFKGMLFNNREMVLKEISMLSKHLSRICSYEFTKSHTPLIKEINKISFSLQSLLDKLNNFGLIMKPLKHLQNCINYLQKVKSLDETNTCNSYDDYFIPALREFKLFKRYFYYVKDKPYLIQIIRKSSNRMEHNFYKTKDIAISELRRLICGWFRTPLDKTKLSQIRTDFNSLYLELYNSQKISEIATEKFAIIECCLSDKHLDPIFLARRIPIYKNISQQLMRIALYSFNKVGAFCLWVEMFNEDKGFVFSYLDKNKKLINLNISNKYRNLLDIHNKILLKSYLKSNFNVEIDNFTIIKKDYLEFAAKIFLLSKGIQQRSHILLEFPLEISVEVIFKTTPKTISRIQIQDAILISERELAQELLSKIKKERVSLCMSSNSFFLQRASLSEEEGQIILSEEKKRVTLNEEEKHGKTNQNKHNCMLS